MRPRKWSQYSNGYVTDDENSVFLDTLKAMQEHNALVDSFTQQKKMYEASEHFRTETVLAYEECQRQHTEAVDCLRIKNVDLENLRVANSELVMALDNRKKDCLQLEKEAELLCDFATKASNNRNLEAPFAHQVRLQVARVARLLRRNDK